MVLRGVRRRLVGTTQRRRLLLLVVVIGLWCGALVGRLLYLQVALHDRLVERARQQQLFTVDLAAQRGDIVDRTGRRLAVSLDLPSIYAHPHKLNDRAAAARLLAPALAMPAEDVAGRLDDASPFVWLQRQARPEVAEAVARVVDEHGLEDVVGFLKESKRFYPNRSLAAHVLGFVDIDGNGQAGVEYTYDDLISGQPGRLLTVRDGGNRPVDPEGLERVEPIPGLDLTLTIDAALQFVAESALADAVEEHGAAGGAAVAIDVRDGAVLAMASLPTFNPNVRDRALVKNSGNRALQFAYEPGSTFKIVTAASALDEGVVRVDEPIDCEGGRLRLANHTYTDWRLGFGVMPFSEVLMNSSNVGTIKVGLRLAPREFHEHVLSLGFGTPTGIDLPAEAGGTVHAPSTWSAVSQSSLSIGYGISVTPIQLVRAVAAVANGGWLVRPHVVARISDGRGRTVERPASPGDRRRVLDPEIAERITGVLHRVVAEGTGRPAAIPGYRIAGKTGTALKIGPDGTYSRYVSSFVGFLPVDDPRVAILVVLDEPTRGYYGSQTAGPVFRRIAQAAIRSLRIPPSIETNGPSRVGHRTASARGPGEAPPTGTSSMP